MFDDLGQVVAQHQQKVSEYRHGAQVEQDPAELLSSLKTCVAGVIESLSDEQRACLNCCGLITQRSSLVAVNRVSGEAISPVLSWQDTRGESLLPEDSANRELIYQATGLKPNGHFGASKMVWLLRHSQAVQQAAEQNQLMFVSLACYLSYHLLNKQEWRADRGNGSRTLLMNLDTGQWDESLLELFGLRKSYLPELVASDSSFGELCIGEVSVDAMSLPMRLLTGDQCAAVFSAGTLPPEQLNINMGTGVFLLSSMPAANVRDGLLSSVVHWSEAQGAQYCLEATVNGAGVAIDYMAKQLGIEGDKQLEQSLAVSQRMPLFINTISGLGSPDWRSDMGAFFVGDEHCSNQLRLAAVAESIIFLIMRNLECMRRHKLLSRIVVSGGLSNSDQLCQRLSDLSGLAVVRSESAEASARGAAYLLLGCPEGWANNGQTFHSQENKALAQRFTVWTDCLETSLG